MENPKPSNGKKTPLPVGPTTKPPSPVPVVPPLFRKIDWLALALTFVFAFTAYYLTLAPELTLEDSGELATGSLYAGIPHPPGYPVWTIYSWLWTVILPLKNICWRVGVSSAFAGALASGLLALVVSRGSSMIIESIDDLKNIDRRWENAICIISGFVAGTLVGFNGYMWSQTVIVEVYPLSVVSLMGVVVCLLRWIYAPHQHRYLFWAFFLYGICFNNHQSLLVIAMSMEVLVLVAEPKMGRELFFWNTILWLAGLVIQPAVLFSNTPVLVIYNIIGIASGLLWLWLLIKTKKTLIEFGRDGAMLAFFGCAALFLLGITHYLPGLSETPTLFLIFVAGLGAGGVFIWLIKQTKKHSKEWLIALGCGGSWLAGAAFYLYEPLAGMSIPPMQWAYPRTVEGFIHAMTRGQYEKIHPTSATGQNIFEVIVNFFNKYGHQLYLHGLQGLLKEFNIVYLLIALVVFLFYRKMKRRERVWVIGMVAFYICLGPFLMLLLNPGSDRQSISLNMVFFTAGHVFVSMSVGYGLTLIAASIATQYDRFRNWFWIGGAIAAMFALYLLARSAEDLFGNLNFFGALRKSFERDQYALPIYAGIILCGSALLFALSTLLLRSRAVGIVLIVFAVMPSYSILTHWSDNEQRGHWFGYWFGHDMFTPPFVGPDGKLSYDSKLREQAMKGPNGSLVYPEMARDTILFGGTDPGRFCPTYMIFCDSFVPPDCLPAQDQHFDRRDVYIITQNALADGTYLEYIRSQYFRSDQKDPPFFQELLRGPKEREDNYMTNILARVAGKLLDRPFEALGARIEARRRKEGVYPHNEIYTPTPADSAHCFSEYVDDAGRRAQMNPPQLKPGEDVAFDRASGKVSVNGQVAVMSINGLLTKVIFDHNPTNEFYVEESMPLDWMYLNLTPFGVIMKINREPVQEITDEMVRRDHEFWSKYTERFIGNWITYDTSVKEITDFVEKVYLRRDYSGFKGDRRFIRDDDAQKSFSKLRSSIGGSIYAWRANELAKQLSKPQGLSPEELQRLQAAYQRMVKEADFAFRQSFAFCPYSPEAVFHYVSLLVNSGRFKDALLIANTCVKLDPYNSQIAGLVDQLKGYGNQPTLPPMGQIQAEIPALENEVRSNPTNFQKSFDLAARYLQVQQPDRAAQVLDQVLNNPHADVQAIYIVARAYSDMKNYPKLEQALEKLVQVAPAEPEAWYDLAALKIALNKSPEALQDLRKSLELSAQRLQKDPIARDMRSNVLVDARFNSLHDSADFKAMTAAH